MDNVNVARELEAMREKPGACQAKDIFHMDETGLHYRWLPAHSFASNDERREACCAKTMTVNVRVTVVRGCTDTLREKLSAAISRSSIVPICLKVPHGASAFSYMSKSCA